MARILVVDDDRDALFAVEQLLKQNSYHVVCASNANQALEFARSENPDLILSDVNMPPGADGYELARQLKADPDLRYIALVLLTSKDNLEDVIFGLEQGADDYVKKPFKSEELLARVNAALRTRALYRDLQNSRRLNRELERHVGEQFAFGNIIGQSAAMREVFQLIEKVKDSDLPVLISGESGTGKELVAAALHFNGPRASKSLLIQNCSAFNENLLESELFGHVRGAFSGAQRDKVGLFEVAHQGSFFLDELGEMSLALQAKLLRVLEDGSFMSVGDTKTKKVDVRIIAATNRDLKQLIAEGKFREDLYYRVNVINIRLPALRERVEDIPLLAQHFLQKAALKKGGAPKKLRAETLQLLCDYAWPGNIRELRNEIEKLNLLSPDDKEIGPELVSEQIRQGIAQGAAALSVSEQGKLKAAVERLEREMIADALKRLKGNKSEAARELGISRSNLIAKVQSYHLEE